MVLHEIVPKLKTSDSLLGDDTCTIPGLSNSLENMVVSQAVFLSCFFMGAGGRLVTLDFQYKAPLKYVSLAVLNKPPP